MRVVSVDALCRQLTSLPVGEPRVVTSGNHAVPWTLLRAADDSLERYRLFVLNAPAGMPDREGVTLETPFVGAGMRGRTGLAYLPCRLSLVPAMLRRRTPPDVVLINTTRPRDGAVSLGVEVNVLPAAIEAARAGGGLVVAQLNDAMPWTYGDAQLAVDEIDLGVEADEPLGELQATEPSPLQQSIGEKVAGLVSDPATLQIGIGAIPDAALSALTGRRGLRIWTEMFSDGLLRLHRAGALADAPITASFAAGSAELYE